MRSGDRRERLILAGAEDPVQTTHLHARLRGKKKVVADWRAGKSSASSRFMERRRLDRKIDHHKRLDAERVRGDVRLDSEIRRLAASNRAERNKTLFRLGSYVEKAGLIGLDDDALLGVTRLLAPFERRPERIVEWKRRGEDLRKQEAREGLNTGSSRSRTQLAQSSDERRRRNRERITKGAALDKGGIGHWNGDTIRGALELIAMLAKRPGEMDKWRKVPVPDQGEIPIAVEIRFPAPIVRELSAVLGRLGFTFDLNDLVWRMTSSFAVLKARAVSQSGEPRIESQNKENRNSSSSIRRIDGAGTISIPRLQRGDAP